MSAPECPRQVEERAGVAIPLADGRILRARLWLPSDGPAPCILEYLPYRWRDGTAARDALTHPWLAAQGYACLRVDIAGTGESDGLFDDEYSEQELSDGEEVIAWAAAQPWCAGAVGMIGISWGGFNGLQLAARRPPALKAVVSICSTVDRYADDIHYKGGCLLGENASWAATVLGWFGLPPDPEIHGPGWRQAWMNRLRNTPFLAAEWLRHQTRDGYWRHGSVCEDYRAIEAAVLSVGGWHDGYRNTVSHLVTNLSAPVKGIVGPWNHKYPHFARPGPRIGFLQEIARWFDRWLKGVRNGAESDPAYRAWLMDGVPPATDYDHRPGRWIAEADWPSPAIAETPLHLTDTGLAAAPAPCDRIVATNLACGLGAGEYFPFGFGPGELPDDQRMDDALSACFEAPATASPTDIVGAPRLTLRLSADRPRAQIAARLCDVGPDGAATLISLGVSNLRQRHGPERMVDLTPGEPVDVAFMLDQCAYRLPAGHRLRLALSPTYWPYIWPEPEAATLRIHGGALHLPTRAPAAGDECGFEAPAMAPALETRALTPPEEAKTVTFDQATGEIRIEISGDTGEVEDLSTGLVSRCRHTELWTIDRADPASARSTFTWERTMRRGDWRARTFAELTQWADSRDFHVTGRLAAEEGEQEIFGETFAIRAPRL